MGWSAQFQDALKERVHTPVFYLEVSKDPSSPGSTGIVFYSHNPVTSGWTPSADHTYAISRKGVRVSSGSVTLLSWSQSYGGLRIGIQGGASSATTICQSVVRGSLVRLFCGFDGWDYADFEPIFTGQVRQLRGSPQQGYVLECWDIVRALGCRWTTTPCQESLFFNLRELSATTVKSGNDYTAADGTIHVTSAASFAREDSGNYLLRITPGSGSVFYARATGLSGTQFTGLTAGVYGTTDADAAAGQKVEHMALLQDGPVDIVKKLLLSTGTAGSAHATFDKYPADWSFGIPLDWVDLSDIDDVMTRYQVNLTWDLDVVITQAQANPISWLQSVIGECGFWLVHRHGRISLRPAQNPVLSTVTVDFHLGDNDIERVIDWSAWDGSRAIEYQSIKVQDANSSAYSVTSSEGITTMPSANAYEITLDHLWDTTGSQHQRGVQDVDNRTEIWAHRIPERVSLILSGLTYAGLCEGDIGYLTSSVIPSRSRDGMVERPCMVLSCTPDWLGGVVRLDLAAVVDWASEFQT